MQKVFGTVTLDKSGLLISLSAGSIIFIIIGFEKWIVRKMIK
jgi:hypothetical protein